MRRGAMPHGLISDSAIRPLAMITAPPEPGRPRGGGAATPAQGGLLEEPELGQEDPEVFLILAHEAGELLAPHPGGAQHVLVQVLLLPGGRLGHALYQVLVVARHRR